MRLLLDTNALLWWMHGVERLGPRATAAIVSGENDRFVSVASIWEIRLKQSIGKLDIADDFLERLAEEPFAILAIELRHADRVGALPWHHRDPFDRLLIAQAAVETLDIVTSDRRFALYGVGVVDAER
jgi:PIN domain nuclease of toxin-antitoxin system